MLPNFPFVEEPDPAAQSNICIRIADLSYHIPRKNETPFIEYISTCDEFIHEDDKKHVSESGKSTRFEASWKMSTFLKILLEIPLAKFVL